MDGSLIYTPARPIPTLQCDIADSREAYGVPVIDAALEIRPGPVDFELHMIQVTTPSNHSVYYITYPVRGRICVCSLMAYTKIRAGNSRCR